MSVLCASGNTGLPAACTHRAGWRSARCPRPAPLSGSRFPSRAWCSAARQHKWPAHSGGPVLKITGVDSLLGLESLFKGTYESDVVVEGEFERVRTQA